MALACFAGRTLASAAEPQQGTIAIVHTNDIHCSFQKTDTTYGYAEIAAFYSQTKQQYGEGNTLLVDAGDFVSGAAVGALSKGQDLVALVNAVGYDVAAVGNHEFDYTAAHLDELAADMDFPFVSCNYMSLKTDELVFNPYEILSAGGKKIAFVGVTSPESLTKSNPSNFWDGDGRFRIQAAPSRLAIGKPADSFSRNGERMAAVTRYAPV